jgi:hypothetical protein
MSAEMACWSMHPGQDQIEGLGIVLAYDGVASLIIVKLID